MTRLDEIRARLAAATPGEWRATHGAAVWAAKSDCELEVADCWSPAIRDAEASANADLIAHAPADIAALLAVVDAAREYRACHQRCMTTGCSVNEYQQKRGDLFAALDALEEATT